MEELSPAIKRVTIDHVGNHVIQLHCDKNGLGPSSWDPTPDLTCPLLSRAVPGALQTGTGTSARDSEWRLKGPLRERKSQWSDQKLPKRQKKEVCPRSLIGPAQIGLANGCLCLCQLQYVLQFATQPNCLDWFGVVCGSPIQNNVCVLGYAPPKTYCSISWDLWNWVQKNGFEIRTNPHPSPPSPPSPSSPNPPPISKSNANLTRI